jgi:hypothetical protein
LTEENDSAMRTIADMEGELAAARTDRDWNHEHAKRALSEKAAVDAEVRTWKARAKKAESELVEFRAWYGDMEKAVKGEPPDYEWSARAGAGHPIRGKKTRKAKKVGA